MGKYCRSIVTGFTSNEAADLERPFCFEEDWRTGVLTPLCRGWVMGLIHARPAAIAAWPSNRLCKEDKVVKPIVVQCTQCDGNGEALEESGRLFCRFCASPLISMHIHTNSMKEMFKFDSLYKEIEQKNGIRESVFQGYVRRKGETDGKADPKNPSRSA